MQDTINYKRLQEDDKNALSLLFDKYYSRLCSFALQFNLNEDEAEEIVSDVFLKLWENRKTTNISSFKSYIYTSVKNKALNISKSKKNYFRLNENFFSDDTYYDHSDIEIKENLEIIQTIIQSMPKKRRTIFMLNRIDGLKYKEIAEVLNISVSTVQNQMVKAVKFLHDNYTQKKLQ